jgi:O-6-methylguanine DNA methyltransferase
MQRISIQSKEGAFTAWFSTRGLARLDFPGSGAKAGESNGEHSNSHQANAWKALTAKALAEALAGRTPKKLPPLDLSEGTAFQRQVWAALRQIPAGKTRTYGQVAGLVRKPLASRAVGSACGANPIPILVPCHRVLAAGGGLGGFSSGLAWKRLLLAREGVQV